MKKLFIFLILALTVVASPVFAEQQAPSNTVYTALMLAFTTPKQDYNRDMIMENMGEMQSLQQCDAALIAPDMASRFTGGEELDGMRRTHVGVCMNGSSNPGAAMFVEAVASYPGVHIEVYKTTTVKSFASVQQCKEELPKLALLIPHYLAKFVDIWGSCYATR